MKFQLTLTWTSFKKRPKTKDKIYYSEMEGDEIMQ